MENNLSVYNTLSRKKEKFEPLNAPFVGMYVCGPTVYGHAHLGHAKSYVSFDILIRYLVFIINESNPFFKRFLIRVARFFVLRRIGEY